MNQIEMMARNDFDRAYQYLLQSIMDEGVDKKTRSGMVRSVFGKQMKIDLKQGFPLLTTKKVFTKGIIHELLWFLQHPYNSNFSMNIKYLVENKVHIWDDDAWRWCKELINKQSLNARNENRDFTIYKVRDDGGVEEFEMVEIGAEEREKFITNLCTDKAFFIENVLKDYEISYIDKSTNTHRYYRIGDLGPIYGKQWRFFGARGVDQIKNIITTLKENPNDRRMLCVAFKPDELDAMALPPCHVMFQFYARDLTPYERWELYGKKFDGMVDDNYTNRKITNYVEGVSPWTSQKRKEELSLELENEGIPKMGLSCMFTMRSVDVCLGSPFNIASYALLTSMIGKLVGMEPDMLIASFGDCHIYEKHFEGVQEQLKRNGSDKLPKLLIHGNQESIDDFKYEDFEFLGYEPDAPIKFPLEVGL